MDLRPNRLNTFITKTTASSTTNSTTSSSTTTASNSVVEPISLLKTSQIRRPIRSNGPRMSIKSPRTDPSACFLLLPFLLPVRTRIFLRQLLKKDAVQVRFRPSETVARYIHTRPIGTTSSCARRLGTGVGCNSRVKVGSTLPYIPRITARYFSDDGSADKSRRVYRSFTGGKGRLPNQDAFSMLEQNVRSQKLGDRERRRLRKEREYFDRVVAEDTEFGNIRSREWEREDRLARSLEKAGHRELGVEELAGEDLYRKPPAKPPKDLDEFWELLEEKHPTGSRSVPLKVLDLPKIQSVTAFRPPSRRRARYEKRVPEQRGDNPSSQPNGSLSDDLEANRTAISFRAASLDEYVVFAPDFTTEEEKDYYYSLYTEKFLPPHLQQENTHPTPPIKSKAPASSLTSDIVDAPYPSVFGALVTDPAAGEKPTNNPSFNEMMRGLEIEWESRWTKQSYSKLLYTLEIAREDGIDVLNSLLLRRREREVIWIARRIIDKQPDIRGTNLNVWRCVNAVSDLEFPKKPSMAKTLQDAMVDYKKKEDEDIARRRRGVGILLSSLTSMLLSAWRAEQIGSKTIFSMLTMIDAPSIIDTKEEDLDSQSLFDAGLSHMLDRPAEDQEDAERMTAKEIFSTVAQLLAYLHLENHVPPIVYSEKHPRLNFNKQEIVRIISTEVEAAYGRELGVDVPTDKKIDWSLWLELVNCIAAERGLGVSATWLLLHGENDISWEKDSVDSGSANTNDFTQDNEMDSSLDRKTHGKKIVLPSYLIPQAASTCLHNSAFDAWPPETPGRMLRLLKNVAHTTGPYDMTFARELLDHPEVNIFASYAEDIPKIPVKGAWQLDVYYQILVGTCLRKDLARTIRVWAEIEKIALGESEILDVDIRYRNELPPVVFAPEDSFEHPFHVVMAVLRQFRERRRWDLFRYYVKSVVREEHLQRNAGLMNMMLGHAGDVKDHALAQYLLSVLTPPLTHRTITSVLNMHLLFDQQREAQAILDFMKRSGIQPDHVDLGIVARNTFKQSHNEGYALMERAVVRAGDFKKNKLKDQDMTKVFREGVTLKIAQTEVDPIGPNAWFSTLVASIRGNNREKASEALKNLGVDLGDYQAASKMGVRIFNALLSGVCKREGSVQGMRMYKLYCLPNKRLLKMLDESIKSHRSGDRRIDMGERSGPGRDSAGVKTRRGEEYIVNRGRKDEAKRRELDGVVVPNSITLRTIIHQALKEKRDFFGTKQILGKLPMSEGQTVWMKHNAYFDTGWQEVLDWAREIWNIMDYGLDEWGNLMSLKVKGRRVPKWSQVDQDMELSKLQGQDLGNGDEQTNVEDGGEDVESESDDEDAEGDEEFDEKGLLESYGLPPGLRPDDDKKG
ncbi:hypothetical protein ABW20_dc0106398 [Dactylellina cionopaga]|nr:hypothetical protein ABW20_dc0106398 [Dactylellina cionopaga]